MKRFYLLPFFILALLLCGRSASAQSLDTREVIDSLDTPWEILWGPDNWIWMTERPGRVSRVNPETGESRLLLIIPGVYENSESGLLGMALHPSFADTAWVYLVYNYQESGAIRERLVRYTYNGTSLVNPVTLLEGIPGNTTHDGSRLMIASGKLYMTTGDAQISSAPQSHTSLNGKILRMNLNGSVPADNPFPAAPAPYNLIWTTGHRNPQGLVRAHNGIIYSSEHGPGANDEINIFTRRGNFGWPNVEGPCNTAAEIQYCQDSSVIEPIKSWSPTLATAGLDAYNSTVIPEWTNSLLLVTLKEADLRVLKLSADGLSITGETVYFNNQYGRLRDLCVSPDGRVFIATSNRDGRGAPAADDDRIIEIKGAATRPKIVSITVPPSPLKGGSFFDVTVNTEGLFDSMNVFTIQVSDSNGNFALRLGEPAISRQMGIFRGRSGGTVRVKLPCDVEGSGYRIRALADAPADTGSDNGTDLTVVFEPVVITASGPTTICEGDSVVLSAPEGYRVYFWNDGSTGRSIVAREGRFYSVEAVDSSTCNRRSAPIGITVLPAPNPIVSLSNGNNLSVDDIYTSYQWLRNGEPIPGASSNSYAASRNGAYSVRVVSEQGCTGTSETIDYKTTGVEDIAGYNGAISIHPQPARDRAVVELELKRGGMLEIVIRDARGAVVTRIEEEAGAGTYRREISTRELPAGVYFITVTSGSRKWETGMVRE